MFFLNINVKSRVSQKEHMDFSPQLPPYVFVTQVASHAPLAMSLYLKIWDRKKHDHKLIVNKKSIKDDFLMHPIRFGNMLMQLCEESLLSYKFDGKKYLIEIVAWEDLAMGM